MADGGNFKTTAPVIELPVVKPNVIVPVIELFLK